jgi:hypothetical protein
MDSEPPSSLFFWNISNKQKAIVSNNASSIRMAMGRVWQVEQYHTHTYIVDGYKNLPVPIPMGIKLYPYPYPGGTHTHWVPNG